MITEILVPPALHLEQGRGMTKLMKEKKTLTSCVWELGQGYWGTIVPIICVIPLFVIVSLPISHPYLCGHQAITSFSYIKVL